MKTLSDVSECIKEGERERGMERIDNFKQVTMSAIECAHSSKKAGSCHCVLQCGWLCHFGSSRDGLEYDVVDIFTTSK